LKSLRNGLLGGMARSCCIFSRSRSRRTGSVRTALAPCCAGFPRFPIHCRGNTE
jgi:hypothetical protein